ncbi:hypothetical protein L207DRAFT_231855 [Hyaloscypha variabilis F]|uniref:Uncharacterized protein n=1 Tax=Hyaloscypha variabilis (strain UAMH 11265 / GT02V1 / F) TaxID=1149755 RepID=A0A2J6QUE3_HYAVF|nr:hypothetical protein L207DRAFT_231855 [Hyaloscypha variabilis F]
MRCIFLMGKFLFLVIELSGVKPIQMLRRLLDQRSPNPIHHPLRALGRSWKVDHQGTLKPVLFASRLHVLLILDLLSVSIICIHLPIHATLFLDDGYSLLDNVCFLGLSCQSRAPNSCNSFPPPTMGIPFLTTFASLACRASHLYPPPNSCNSCRDKSKLDAASDSLL